LLVHRTLLTVSDSGEAFFGIVAKAAGKINPDSGAYNVL
jgi:hypothetical protein